MAGGEDSAPAGSKTPADFLKSIKGKPVVVKLKSGVDYRGELGRSSGGAPRRHRGVWAQLPSSIHRPALPPQAFWPAWTAT